MTHPDLLLGLKLETPEERIKAITRFYLSGFYIRPKVRRLFFSPLSYHQSKLKEYSTKGCEKALYSTVGRSLSMPLEPHRIEELVCFRAGNVDHSRSFVSNYVCALTTISWRFRTVQMFLLSMARIGQKASLWMAPSLSVTSIACLYSYIFVVPFLVGGTKTKC